MASNEMPCSDDSLDKTTVAGVEELEHIAQVTATVFAGDGVTSSNSEAPLHRQQVGASSAGTLHLSAKQEDLMLQNRILMSRLEEERLLMQKVEDEAKFFKFQVAAREKKINALESEKASVEGRLKQLQRLIDEKEGTNVQLRQCAADLREEVAQQKRAVLDLQRQVRNSVGVGASVARAIVPDRRFEETFQDKVSIIRLEKKVRRHFQSRERTMQALESNAMEAEDARSMLANELGVIDKIPGKSQDEAEEGSRSQQQRRPRAASLVSFESVKRYGTRGTGSLPYREVLDLRTPQDAFVEAKINASAFHMPIAAIKEAIYKMANEVKEANDKTLGSLCYIFEDSSKKGRGLLASPKEDFEKEIRDSIVGFRIKLHTMAQSLGKHIVTLINSEKPVRLQWALEGRSSIDFGCQVEVPPPEDPRIEQLREQLAFVNNRSSQLRKEYNTKINHLELLKDKSEVNTQYIQQKIFQLHDGLYQALHAVYRHRFHWVNRFTNSFQGIERTPKKSTALEVSFNVKLGQAVDEDLHYLRKLADYFVSDDLFGADLAVETPPTNKNHENNNNYLVAKRKAASIPTRKKIDQARKLSGQLETYLRDELTSFAADMQQQQQQQENVGTLPSFGAVAVDSEGSLASTPQCRSLESSLTAHPVPRGPAAPISIALRYSRSANSSPEPRPSRPQSARTRSGSQTQRSTPGGTQAVNLASSTIVPSKPPIGKKASAGSFSEDDLGAVRRVQSFTAVKRTSSFPMSESLSCAKVTLQLDTDVLVTAQENDDSTSFVKIGSSVSKSFGGKRPLNI